MSYETEADRKLENTKEYIQLAIECLSDVIITKTAPGIAEYPKEKIKDFNDILFKLLEIRDKF